MQRILREQRELAKIKSHWISVVPDIQPPFSVLNTRRAFKPFNTTFIQESDGVRTWPKFFVVYCYQPLSDKSGKIRGANVLVSGERS